MDIMLGLTAVNSALEVVKSIRDIEKDFDASTLKLAIADLTSSLADAKMTLVGAEEEKQELLAEIKKIKSSFAFGDTLIEHKGYKYYSNDEGKPTGNAFCQVCERNDGKYFQLTPSKGIMQFTCPNCKSVFHSLPSFI